MHKISISEARRQMMHPAGVINLNAGTCSPVGSPVFESLIEHLRKQCADPADYIWNSAAAPIEAGRKSLATFIECNPENLLLMTNASYGINTIIQTYPWKAGDEIITTDQEYHHYQTLFQKIVSEKGVRLVKVQLPIDEAAPLEAADICSLFEKKKTKATRATFFSHITSPTGFCLPLTELCSWAKKNKILSIVDGAHAPGHIPVSMQSSAPDFYVANVHKWMMNPAGCAFLYAADSVRYDFKPLLCMSGYNAIANKDDRKTVYGTSAWSFAHEYQGTRNLTSIAVLEDSLQFYNQIGLTEIQKSWEFNRQKLVGLLRSLNLKILEPSNKTMHSCMVACRIPTATGKIDGYKARKYFREHHQLELAFPALEDGSSLLRVSAAWFNTEEHFAALAKVLEGFDWNAF